MGCPIGDQDFDLLKTVADGQVGTWNERATVKCMNEVDIGKT